MWRAISLAAAMITVGCTAPVAAPAQASGELIAFGGGPGGPRDACFACHGVLGEGDGLSPRLRGLSRGYLIKQLEDYGGRWRDNPVMSPIAKRLSDADRLAVASYYVGLAAFDDGSFSGMIRHRLYTEGDPARGLEPCSTCHEKGGSDHGLSTPVLTGQTQAYVRAQLLAWKESRRRNDPRDIMGAIARKLGKAEIESLAAAVASR